MLRHQNESYSQTFIKEEGTLIINSAYMFVFKKNI